MDKGDIAGYTTFFTTWLKDKRAKHSVRSVGKATTFSFAVDKEAEKSDRTQQVVVIEGDTMSLGAHISKGTCDVIVADLPYGVQHAGKTGGVTRRSPIDLLNAALPVWRLSLRTGGAMALAFNRRTLSIDDATAVAESAGLRVVQSALGPDAFVHRVDHSIERDVLILQR